MKYSNDDDTPDTYADDVEDEGRPERSQKSFRNRSFGGRKNFGQNREMHKTKCAECGQECEVPFKPDGTRPVYCRDCYRKKKGY